MSDIHHREIHHLRGTPRSAIRSVRRTHWQTVKDQKSVIQKLAAPLPRKKAMQALRRRALAVRRHTTLLTRATFDWLSNYLRFILRSRHPFPVYAGSAEGNGIFPLESQCCIALAGDWGSGTTNAYKVGDAMRGWEPDYTIHLGDVYYVGSREEFDRYFLPEAAWPRGSRGSFALNGNHEMYSGGYGYFVRALPQLGLQYKSKPAGQPASYFCLENEHWRIVSLDTAYYSRTLPFLELFDTYFIRLHRAQLDWLRETVFRDAKDLRPVLLLSHHNWYSAFESEYRRLGRELQPYLDKVFLWIWAHEHRFSGYGLSAPAGQGPAVRARCLGHGGMPVELGHHPKRERRLVFSDDRFNADSTREISAVYRKDRLGYCGYAVLLLDGPLLQIEYYDEDNTQLMVEVWENDGSAQPKGSLPVPPERLTKYGEWEELVS